MSMPLSHAGLRVPRMWVALIVAAFVLMVALSGCDTGSAPPPTPTSVPQAPTVEPSNTPVPVIPTDTPLPPPTNTPVPVATNTPDPNLVAERIKSNYVPVLCYHHIRDFRKSDTGDDKAYIVPPSTFEDTLKYLKSKGYTGVVSQQVYDYYAYSKPLPPKPIMLSFDDNDGTQYTNALPLLKKYGFNATFFIMTVTIDKENYMTTEQLKGLDKQGYDLQPHTWDHHMVTKYKTDDDWQTQIVEPKKSLEEMLGHPTPFFAYPYGIYSSEAADKIKSYGYKGAFRLNENMDPDNGPKTNPLFAIRRYIANPFYTDEQFDQVLLGTW